MLQADQVQESERELRAATLANDVSAHERLIHADWININANGSTTHKPQLLKLLAEFPFSFISIEDDEVLVRCFECFAIVTGRSGRRREGLDGSEIVQEARFTRVWIDTEEGLRVLSAQATPVV